MRGFSRTEFLCSLLLLNLVHSVFGVGFSLEAMFSRIQRERERERGDLVCFCFVGFYDIVGGDWRRRRCCCRWMLIKSCGDL